MIFFVLGMAWLVAAGSAMAEPVLAEGVRVPIQGHWTSGCFSLGKEGRHGVMVSLEISPLGDMAARAQMFAHRGCDRPTVLARYRGKIVANEGEDGHGDLDHRVEQVRLSVSDPEALTLYNDQPVRIGCGFPGAEPWHLHEPRSVAGRTCGAQVFASPGTVLQDHYWLAGEELSFGSFPLLLESDMRPETPGPVTFYRIGGADMQE